MKMVHRYIFRDRIVIPMNIVQRYIDRDRIEIDTTEDSTEINR